MNPIEALAARIQQLPAEIRWFHAQEDAILASAFGLRPARGPWTARADRLVAMSSRLGIERLAAAIVNLLLLAAIFVAQFGVRAVKPPSGLLFVGMGALREPQLIQQFETIYGQHVIELSAFDLHTFFRYQRVGPAALFREWLILWREIWSSLDPAGPPPLIERQYCLTHLILRGHRFAYYRAWFRRYAKGERPRIGFSLGNYAAFAAIAAGANAVHMQHGFQARSLVYPDFAEAYCSNRFDAEHVSKRLPRTRVSVLPEKFRPLNTNRVAAIAGSYWQPDGFDLCRSFIEWARLANIPVFVRKHPNDASRYWDQWRGVEGVQVVETQYEFEDFLDEFRPCILATWNSTTILDALVKGVVPITFALDDHPGAGNTVFPVREVALRWPEQRMLVQAMLDDPQARGALVAERYQAAMGGADGTNATAMISRTREGVLR